MSTSMRLADHVESGLIEGKELRADEERRSRYRTALDSTADSSLVFVSLRCIDVPVARMQSMQHSIGDKIIGDLVGPKAHPRHRCSIAEGDSVHPFHCYCELRQANRDTAGGGAAASDALTPTENPPGGVQEGGLFFVCGLRVNAVFYYVKFA